MLAWAKGDLGRIGGRLDRPAIDAILVSLGQKLLQRQAGRLGLWPGGLRVKEDMDGTPAANDAGEQEEAEQACEKEPLPRPRKAPREWLPRRFERWERPLRKGSRITKHTSTSQCTG